MMPAEVVFVLRLFADISRKHRRVAAALAAGLMLLPQAHAQTPTQPQIRAPQINAPQINRQQPAAPQNQAQAPNAREPLPQPTPFSTTPGLPPGPPPQLPPAPLDKVQFALDQTAPLTPAELTELMTKLHERQLAAGQNITGRPQARPVTSSELLDLSPGGTPPVVRVAVGQGAVLSFSDSAGRPWPLVENLNFNSRAYTTKVLAPHLYAITLNTREVAHVTVVLKDLPRPIVITVLPAQDETDYLKEYTIPRFVDGLPPPSVAASSREGALAFNSQDLISYLYRTPPAGARSLTINGLPGVTAWQSAPGRMVVRTAGQVVIPAWSRRHAANDGVAVFELPLSPIVSITEGGALHRVSVGGYVVESRVRTSP